MAVGTLQLQLAFSLRLRGLDLVGLRQRREQRLRLSDLRHFRRRREAFERGREDGVGVGGAAGRLIELGERERGAQSEAARALLLRDGDGGQEGFFRGRGVGGVALQQHFAARPMQLRFERAVTGAVACRQRFVEDRNGAAGSPARASASASAIFISPSNHQNVLFAQKLCAAAHVLEPAADCARRQRSPNPR